MRIVNSGEITETVKRLCIEANYSLPQSIRERISALSDEERWPLAREVLGNITENYELAETKLRPICQDTGVVCVFLEIGQDIHIEGGLSEAVDDGVRRGYAGGYLRASIAGDPLRRVNTGDNTPAMLYTELTAGESLKITVAPKGFGSENMSRIKMLTPSDGVEGVIEFVLNTVAEAGPNPCPPIIAGVGIGGTFDKAALLSKKALLRPAAQPNPDPYYAALELELLDKLNGLGIGPQGFGGRTTALAVHIETLPTHIAGLPCAVNIGCHVTRHASVTI